MNHSSLGNFYSNKISIVTGATGLLGKEHCKALAEIGHSVVVTDIDKTSVDRYVAELNNLYPSNQFLGIVMDVTNENSIQDCLNSILKKFNKIDVLVNNAAIDPKVSKDSSNLEKSRLENFERSDWDFQINVGLTGAMLCSKFFGASMAKSGGGVILNIASDLSVFSPDQRIYRKPNLDKDQQPVKPVTYSVIKHALIGLTKYLATYWADQNVRSNALSPGGVFNNQPDDFVKNITKLIPAGRMANKEEYRSAVQFLCSDASLYMNGQNIIMDGGRSVW